MEIDEKAFKGILGRTIDAATLLDEELLLLKFSDGTEAKIAVGSSTDPAIDFTPFLYLEDLSGEALHQPERSELREALDEIERLRTALEWISNNGPDDAYELRAKADEALGN